MRISPKRTQHKRLHFGGSGGALVDFDIVYFLILFADLSGLASLGKKKKKVRYQLDNPRISLLFPPLRPTIGELEKSISLSAALLEKRTLGCMQLDSLSSVFGEFCALSMNMSEDELVGPGREG